MKKIIFILIGLFQISNACICGGVINSSFSSFREHISSKLNLQAESLKKLQESIAENTKVIEEQTKIINKDNNVLKNDLLETDRKVFELKKTNEMR